MMNEKVFHRLLIAVAAAGILSVIVLIVYTYFLYKDCSIITYIANRR